MFEHFYIINQKLIRIEKCFFSKKKVFIFIQSFFRLAWVTKNLHPKRKTFAKAFFQTWVFSVLRFHWKVKAQSIFFAKIQSISKSIGSRKITWTAEFIFTNLKQTNCIILRLNLTKTLSILNAECLNVLSIWHSLKFFIVYNFKRCTEMSDMDLFILTVSL
jgi:hypothetical protein